MLRVNASVLFPSFIQYFRFYPRWKETEGMHMQSLQFSLEESQWQQDWAILLSLASQPGR